MTENFRHWTTTKKTQTSDVKLVDTKVQYTGKKKVSKGTTTYKHIKTETKDNWTYDTTWTDELKTQTTNLKISLEYS